MAVREIDIAEHWDAALPLMQANWQETGCGFGFAPSREFFEAAQQRGLFYAVGGFVDGELAGYCGVTIAPSPFNPSVGVASGNPLYVAPAYRGGALCARLMLAAEQIARKRGATFAFWHMRADTAAGDSLGRHGYECVDNVWMRGL